jgi:ribosomal RNA-processing protein 9
MKKKPIYTRLKCHGVGSRVLVNGEQSQVDAIESTDPNQDTVPSWITSLAAVPFTDMFASGSADGFIRFWKLSESKKSFTLLNSIPVNGFANSMCFFNSKSLIGKDDKMHLCLGIAVGQEHRLGRWWRIKDSKNEARVYQLGTAIN